MTTSKHDRPLTQSVGEEQPAQTTLELLLREIGQPYTEEHRQLERKLANILAIVRLVEEYEKMRQTIESLPVRITYGAGSR